MLNTVITGKSLLTSTSKIIKSDADCTYLEYKSFCDFIEAIILHDNLIILGPFNNLEKEAQLLLDELNSNYESSFIQVEDIDKRTNIKGTKLDFIFKDILDKTFINNKTSFIRDQLKQKEKINRYTDDEKNIYMDNIISVFDNEDEKKIFSSLEKFISDIYHNHTNSEFVNYLFRAFVVASLAIEHNASALFTGSRKPIGILIKNRCIDFKFETLTYSIYKYANALYLNSQFKNIKEGNLDFYIPLLVSHVFRKCESKEFLLENILNTRDDFSKFRHLLWKKSIKDQSMKSHKRNENKIAKIKSYYNERYRLFSDNNFKNFAIKIGKEIFLDNTDVKFEYESDDGSNDEDTKFTSEVNVVALCKNAMKIISDLGRNEYLKYFNKPLGKILCSELSNKNFLDLRKLINISEYYRNKMKNYDKLIREYNI